MGAEATGALQRPILIIDDDDDAHFLLRRALTKVGVDHPSESVMGGDVAIAYLDRCSAGQSVFPALVFLDVKMPGTGGFEVLSWMRERQLLGYLTVVMLTSSDDPKDVARAMSLGAHSYLTKPPASDTLRQVVMSALKLATVAQVPAKLAGADGPGRKIHVLVVDDSGFARRTTRRLLEAANFTVEEASGGAEAIERCSANPPDVVFLDLVMGAMDGREVISRLRALRANVRIVVVSADTQDSTRDSVIRAGALAYIHKPLSSQKLSAVVTSVLSTPPWK